ncbi:DUF1269 domain-containing protein [Glycomyces tenuis]|uniref:DUF1269 domain-containing protein n=1 Tax=Glycomyces tenuis TaxID=58116 RepID=UPI000406AC3E|nr:DUF1269 domain-containing protein [Glycomyces tenuis]
MSNLFVIGYPDAVTAEQARDKFLELQRSELLALQDIAIAENHDGKIKLRQIRSDTGIGATSGALWGGLIGLLFFMPLLGMAVGAGAGAIGGSATDSGVNDDLMRELGQQLTPGAAAVFALVEQATYDKVIDALEPLGGKLVQTSLSTEEESALREAIAQARAARA